MLGYDLFIVIPSVSFSGYYSLKHKIGLPVLFDQLIESGLFVEFSVEAVIVDPSRCDDLAYIYDDLKEVNIILQDN